MQPRILSNLLCFFTAWILARRYHNYFDTSLISGMHILKEVCYVMVSFPAIHFFYDRVIISREHLQWSICQRYFAYFATLAATIHYNKRSVVDSRKFERCVYLRKAILALWISNHWISWYFFLKSKNGFHGNAFVDCKTYAPQVGFTWVGKIKDIYHLQSSRQLTFQCENIMITLYVLILIIL